MDDARVTLLAARYHGRRHAACEKNRGNRTDAAAKRLLRARWNDCKGFRVTCCKASDWTFAPRSNSKGKSSKSGTCIGVVFTVFLNLSAVLLTTRQDPAWHRNLRAKSCPPWSHFPNPVAINFPVWCEEGDARTRDFSEREKPTLNTSCTFHQLASLVCVTMWYFQVRYVHVINPVQTKFRKHSASRPRWRNNVSFRRVPLLCTLNCAFKPCRPLQYGGSHRCESDPWFETSCTF